MSRLVAAGRYLAIVGALFGLVASATAFVWGAASVVQGVVLVLEGEGTPVLFVRVMDQFLVASGLLFLSLGLYELFVDANALPAQLGVLGFDDLKAKLLGVLVMAMGTAFLEHLEEQVHEPWLVLASGVGVASVIAAMAAFVAVGHRQRAEDTSAQQRNPVE